MLTWVDVSVTAYISCEDEILQKETVAGTRHVLGGNLHGTEFVEFVVFDVLMLLNSRVVTAYGFYYFCWGGNFGGFWVGR